MTLCFSILINICLGFSYTWSIFVLSLAKHLGRTLAEVTLAYTIGTTVFTMSNIVGGRLFDKFGPVSAIRIGAILFGGGLFLTGLTSSLIWLYFFYGVVTYSGIGLAYCAVLMNVNNYYPEKRGAVSGLVTAAYGLSAVVFSPVATTLIENFGVLIAYRALGLFFILILTFSSFFVRRAPKAEKKYAGGPKGAPCDLTWNQMIRTSSFYIIYALMIIGATGGLMIISQASVMAQHMMRASAGTAAFTLSLIAGANTAGRLAWGLLSDKAGRVTTQHFIFLISPSMLLCLTFVGSSQYALFTAFAMLIAFCYGGIMGTFPALSTERFGTKNSGTNYSIIMTGLGFASLIGPMTAANILTLTGGYGLAFYTLSALGFIGFFLTFVLRKQQLSRASGLRI